MLHTDSQDTTYPTMVTSWTVFTIAFHKYVIYTWKLKCEESSLDSRLEIDLLGYNHLHKPISTTELFFT